MTQPESPPPPREIFPVTFPGRPNVDYVPVAEAKTPDTAKPTVARKQSDTGLKDFRAIRRDKPRPIEMVQLPGDSEGEAGPKASSATGNATSSQNVSPTSLVDLEALRALVERESQQKSLPEEPAPWEIGETELPAGESLPSDEANPISSFLPM